MSTPILATKLYIPPPRLELVHRTRLIERLNEGVRSGRKLTLISASAGFGKTTLVSEWVAGCGRQVAWLSLDEGDNDAARFLSYLVSALQTITPTMGAGVMGLLQSPQPPSIDTMLTFLLNDMAALSDTILLVLDDYHVIETQAIDKALIFLIEHLPPKLHLVMTTREDPPFPLARLRVRGQLTELRVSDLRFTASEAAGFLNHVMGLNLSAEHITALESRTEGWIAGLQLAALALQGILAQPEIAEAHQDKVASFIQSFSGGHHFVLDYLLEEVLHQQPENIQTFLLKTSMLNRMCGPLCEAVLGDPSGSGQAMLEYLHQANLFILPLDNERRWYRYYHLFVDLLRQRLQQKMALTSEAEGIAPYHQRASQWYEDNGLILEAFHHATVAPDIERATRLLVGDGVPLHFRGAILPVLTWLNSLPNTVLDAEPTLWVMYASALSMTGQTISTEQKLQSAEAALAPLELTPKNRNLIGHIAAIRAFIAATQYQVETIITQSHRALEYLHPDNLAVRTATIWKLGFAYQLQGDRAAASRAYREAIAISQRSKNHVIAILATTGLAQVQESENQLYQAAQIYQQVLQQVGDSPLPIACEAYLGLARIDYEWNNLAQAEEQLQQSLKLARLLENSDRFVACNLFLAHLKLAQADVAGALTLVTQVDQAIQQHQFTFQIPDLAAVHGLILLKQGQLTAALELAEKHQLPLSQAKVYLAQGKPISALAILEPFYQNMEAQAWVDKQLKALVLIALAQQALGETEQALSRLTQALGFAETGGFSRIFVNEGQAMAQLLSQAKANGIAPEYTAKLLTAFPDFATTPSTMLEPLSERELEVLRLIAQGLSNREIGKRLFLALDTVKGHNRRIFGKLQVQRRTEAVARARELGLM